MMLSQARCNKPPVLQCDYQFICLNILSCATVHISRSIVYSHLIRLDCPGLVSETVELVLLLARA